MRMWRAGGAYGACTGSSTSWPAGSSAGTSARFSSTVLPVQHRNAADAVQVGHDVLAEWAELPQQRHPRGDLVKIVDGERHLRLARHGQHVQHRVGAAAQRHGHGDGILERLAGGDLARGDAALQAGEQRVHRVTAVLSLVLGDAAFPSATPMVAMVLAVKAPAQAPAPGQACRSMCSSSSSVMRLAERAPIASIADTKSRLRCGPPADGNEAVGGIRLVLALDAVGNEVAAHQRVAHAGRAHGLTVRHHRRAVQQRLAAALAHVLGDHRRQLVHVRVARRGVGETRRDGDERFAKVIVLEVDGAEHGARCGAADPVGRARSGAGQRRRPPSEVGMRR
eukprot:ctg_469.g230